MVKKLRIIYVVLFLGILLTEIFIALFVKDNFVRPYVGDILVTVLICSFFRIFVPKDLRTLPVCVFAFAAIVEIGQYIDIVKLLGLENNRFFSVLLGRTFSVYDLACYAFGCVLFFVVEQTVRRHLNRS